jgi:hypothetical protein
MFISGGDDNYWTSDISTFWDEPHVLWNDTYWRVLYIKHMFGENSSPFPRLLMFTVKASIISWISWLPENKNSGRKHLTAIITTGHG